MRRALFLFLLACTSWMAAAKEATPLAEDPVVEQRLIAISEQMRCLVCQNETLAESRADLAQDLRRELRELIRQGRSDEEIKAFMVSRYGDFVLYRPPLKPTTWLLWIGPFVLMPAAVVVLLIGVRRRRSDDVPAALSDQQREHVRGLLGDEENS